MISEIVYEILLEPGVALAAVYPLTSVVITGVSVSDDFTLNDPAETLISLLK